MEKYTGPIFAVALFLITISFVGFIANEMIRNTKRGADCRVTCHPTVSKRMDEACYCADGVNWMLKYRDEEVE